MSSRGSRNPTSFIDFAVVTLLAGVMCLWGLGDNPFGPGDQTTHAKVTQEMLHTGRWWQPTNGGVPYYNKPPLKMWISLIPVSILGESEFAYRLPDALCGIAVTLIVFFFASRLFASRLTGYLSVLALLGCNAFFFGHGVRVATQDAMLLLLVTLATVLGYSFLVRREEEDPLSFSPKRRAAVIGALIGLAVMTKSVAGLMPVFVLLPYAVLGGYMRAVWHERKAVLLAAGIAILLPALYIVPHFFYSRTAFGMMFSHEVYKRAVQGYHHVNRPWFYVGGIFLNQLAVPPLLAVAGLLWGVRHAVRGDRRFIFLLLWAVVPIAIYSAARSRLFWYIMPSLPPLSILCGAVLGAAMTALYRAWHDRRFLRPAFAPVSAAALVTVAGIYGLVVQLGGTVPRVFSAKEQNLTSEINHSLKKQVTRSGTRPLIASFRAPRLASHEYLYWEMFPYERVKRNTPILPYIAERKPDFLLTSADRIEKVLSSGAVRSYAYLPPIFRRREWLVLFDLSGRFPLPEQMTGSTEEYGADRLESAFGLTWKMEHGTRIVKKSTSPEFSVLLPGDPIREQFPTEIEVVTALEDEWETPLTADLFLNREPLGRKIVIGKDFTRETLTVPAGTWRKGTNMLTVATEGAENLAGDAPRVLMTEVSVRLVPPV